MKKIFPLLACLCALERTAAAQTFASNWSPLGPVNMPYFESSMGRVNCVTGPAGNTNELFIGTPGGGVWRSDNGGLTWTPRTDFLPVLSVSSLVIDPANPNTIYMATGDADSPYLNTYSIGVWKSTDGGTNWNTTGLSFALTSYEVIYKLAMAPGNSQEIFAATSGGLYVTYNGGTNWTQSTPGGNTVFYDIQFQPGNSSVIYLTAQGAAFYQSANGGTNWNHITSGLPSSGVDRSELGVSAANPPGVYILYGDSSTGGMQGIYQSTNSGTSFTQQTASNLTSLMFDGQEGYDLALAVSPTNFNNVFAAGNLIGSSADGGNTWQTATYSGTHVDVHGLMLVNGALYGCTDGGIHRTLDGGNTWQDLSTNLQIAQIYHVGAAPENPALIYVGEQDDGLNRYSGGVWSHLLAGDFGQPIVDPTNQSVVYATAHGTIFKTTNSWGSDTTITVTGTEPSAFEAPLVMSPVNSQTLFGGYENIWESTNGGAAWSPISTFSDGAVCSMIAVAPSNPAYLYAIRNSTTWRTTNGGPNWTQIYSPAAGNPIAVAVSPNDPNKIWLAQNDFSDANRVYSSTNGGSNWTAYSASLPGRNINCLLYEGGSGDGLYAGLDAGVYYRDSTMTNWQAFNTNLPNARVVDLQIEYATQGLLGATFGRGLWETLLAGSSAALPVISGPLQPSVGQGNAYTFTPVTKATDYQWQQMEELAFNLFDGAEGGLANFSANISSGYSLTSSTVKASGSYSFHLTQPQPADQTLTSKYSLLAQSNSSVQFASLLGYATSTQVAEVQVSTDGGNSWQNVYSQPGSTQESSFSTRLVSLSNFAGSTVQLRFDFSYQGGSYYPETNDGFGWYVDNITLTNFQLLTNTVLATTATTNFNFTPTQAGNYLLGVRGIVYGPTATAFGPLLAVTAASSPRPVLGYHLSGGKLTLTWSDPAFSLEQSPTLAPTAWTPVAGSSPMVITVEAPGNRFFRLVK